MKCPKCGKDVYRKNEMLVCQYCDWETTAKRKEDEKLPDLLHKKADEWHY